MHLTCVCVVSSLGFVHASILRIPGKHESRFLMKAVIQIHEKVFRTNGLNFLRTFLVFVGHYFVFLSLSYDRIDEN